MSFADNFNETKEFARLPNNACPDHATHGINVKIVDVELNWRYVRKWCEVTIVMESPDSTCATSLASVSQESSRTIPE